MSHIVISQAQAWLEGTKLTLGELDDELEDTVSTQIISMVARTYDTSGWTGPTNTPKLIVKLIAMEYAVWFYRRQYSEDEDTGGPNYADKLQAMIDSMIAGILALLIPLPDAVPPLTDTQGGSDPSGPGFYPTDSSNAGVPNNPTGPWAVDNDLSLGPPAFSMGQTF